MPHLLAEDTQLVSVPKKTNKKPDLFSPAVWGTELWEKSRIVVLF